ncbi:MAG: 50S ribosomal protein L2 [Parcubacteria group bacterium GW2011_GWC2_42_12]|uniref:Large ribosomal subunit protein uL2 n=2 Tax=Candidatus Falkowiibacteriota TaxID=1752728 RepID=A0A1F5S793_9BACT|nr:MAG: 50S ribosomal protein L2 [Candidatus Falkowbacteria bacterium GW2011_GWA2_41_14]KKS35142.1 MAG: 50S ribosomal protein L2 [Parcubacteria group bacterium GW2011_GWC2_42_12]OGF22527.1 MAG: 50S ribosomal protein L2 [Candidatus Falkowbacteria bacterium RIFCSPHIGHO2_02_FULL_42_9]
MGIKIVKPTSPGRRSATFDDFSDLTKIEPEKSLIFIKKSQAGRNNTGKITVRHQGGGVKRYIRQIDFFRDKFDIPGKVMSIEYDPNRGARISLVYYKDGAKRYIIMPVGLKVGDEILSSKKQIEIKVGNAMPIKFIPPGVQVYNIELEPGRGGKIARAAGNLVLVMGILGDNAQIKMPSSEIRLVNKECLATVGQVSNLDRNNIVIGRAGRQRLLGVRPTVRGTAMNPVDHPHGGGEGKQSIGLKHPKTKWGKPALGVKTRKSKKRSNRLIISRRKK